MTELKTLVRDFHRAQRDLRQLRAIGAKESDIRNVMSLMGFEGVTPDEFLAASTAEDFALLLANLGVCSVN